MWIRPGPTRRVREFASFRLSMREIPMSATSENVPAPASAVDSATPAPARRRWITGLNIFRIVAAAAVTFTLLPYAWGRVLVVYSQWHTVEWWFLGEVIVGLVVISLLNFHVGKDTREAGDWPGIFSGRSLSFGRRFVRLSSFSTTATRRRVGSCLRDSFRQACGWCGHGGCFLCPCCGACGSACSRRDRGNSAVHSVL